MNRGPFKGPLNDDWHLGAEDTQSLERIFPLTAGTATSASNDANPGIPEATVAIDKWHIQPFIFAKPGGRIYQVTLAYLGNDGTETGENVGLALWDKNFNLLHVTTGTRSIGSNLFTNFSVDWRGVPQACFIGVAHADAAGNFAKANVLAHLVGSVVPGDKSYAFFTSIIWPGNPYTSNEGAWNAPPDRRNGDIFFKSSFVAMPFGQYVSWSKS